MLLLFAPFNLAEIWGAAFHFVKTLYACYARKYVLLSARMFFIACMVAFKIVYDWHSMHFAHFEAAKIGPIGWIINLELYDKLGVSDICTRARLFCRNFRLKWIFGWFRVISIGFFAQFWFFNFPCRNSRIIAFKWAVKTFCILLNHSS